MKWFSFLGGHRCKQMFNRTIDFIVLAQTRQQQVDKDERARLANDPKALKAYERSLEKKKESQQSILASIEKEEKRYEMESFHSYVTLIRSKIGTVEEGRDDMWKISSQAMISVNDEQVAELSSRMELISGRTNKNAQEIRQLLKELEEKNKQLLKKYPSDSAYMRIRLLQYDALVRKFTLSIGEFEQTENAIQSKQRELLVRRFKIVKPELEEKEILDSLEGGDGGGVGAVNVFAFAANAEDLERKLEHLRAQRRSMMRLEKSILALNKLFFDMQNLVLAQGDALNNIENYTQRTLDYQKANTIEQAVQYQKNIRKIRCSII